LTTAGAFETAGLWQGLVVHVHPVFSRLHPLSQRSWFGLSRKPEVAS